jgi:hypothetical protein
MLTSILFSDDLLRKDGSARVHFAGVRAVEMTDSFAENFKMRFICIRNCATKILHASLPVSRFSELLKLA